jgi:transcriptional regulator with XRE-family HTH domain
MSDPRAHDGSSPLLSWPQSRAASRRLRELRGERDLTGVRLARMAGLRDGRVAEMEQASVCLRAADVAAVAAVLGVTPEDLTKAGTPDG